jgi:hypothetical protein
MFDLATLTAILYAARLQRRVPESGAEKYRTVLEALADARLIAAAVAEEEAALNHFLKPTADANVPEPEQPPPSPGIIGRIADAKATRRRG